MYLTGAAVLSVGLVFVAIACVRLVAVRQSSRSVSPHRSSSRLLRLPKLCRWLPHPSLDKNPVLWREWRRQQRSGWIAVVWTVYVMLAGSFSLLGLLLWLASPNTFLSSFAAELASAVQVCVGLFLLNIFAVTGLGEERARGNLEQLLVTPLSATSILWGKWWGVFRTVPWLAVIPCLTASAFAYRSGGWLWVLATGGLVLSYGAAITSLGIASMIWRPRLGHALVLSTCVYALTTVGWPSLHFLVSDGNVVTALLASGSPFFGVLGSIEGATRSGKQDYDYVLIVILTWIVFYSLVAFFLLYLTRKDFYRCLGGIDPLD
jgi:ABC-type transport system involved in multi-copper enzyme maturation permease subunit